MCTIQQLQTSIQQCIQLQHDDPHHICCIQLQIQIPAATLKLRQIFNVATMSELLNSVTTKTCQILIRYIDTQHVELIQCNGRHVYPYQIELLLNTVTHYLAQCSMTVQQSYILDGRVQNQWIDTLNRHSNTNTIQYCKFTNIDLLLECADTILADKQCNTTHVLLQSGIQIQISKSLIDAFQQLHQTEQYNTVLFQLNVDWRTQTLQLITTMHINDKLGSQIDIESNSYVLYCHKINNQHTYLLVHYDQRLCDDKSIYLTNQRCTSVVQEWLSRCCITVQSVVSTADNDIFKYITQFQSQQYQTSDIVRYTPTQLINTSQITDSNFNVTTMKLHTVIIMSYNQRTHVVQVRKQFDAISVHDIIHHCASTPTYVMLIRQCENKIILFEKHHSDISTPYVLPHLLQLFKHRYPQYTFIQGAYITANTDIVEYSDMLAPLPLIIDQLTQLHDHIHSDILLKYRAAEYLLPCDVLDSDIFEYTTIPIHLQSLILEYVSVVHTTPRIHKSCTVNNMPSVTCPGYNICKIVHPVELARGVSLAELTWNHTRYNAPAMHIGVQLYVHASTDTDQTIHTLQPIDDSTTVLHMTTPHVPPHIIDQYNRMRIHQSNKVILLILASSNQSSLYVDDYVNLTITTATSCSYKQPSPIDIVDHRACHELQYQYDIYRDSHTIRMNMRQGIKRWQLLARSCCGQDQTYIQRVADLFAQQLQCDETAYSNNQSDHVSMAGIGLGAIHTALNQQTRLAHKVSYLLYPPLLSSERASSLARCAELLHFLRRWIKPAVLHQYWGTIGPPTFKSVSSLTKTEYEQRKQQPISTAVATPLPMPVKPATIETLQPFFTFLAKNHIPTDSEWTYNASKPVQLPTQHYSTDDGVPVDKQTELYEESKSNYMTGTDFGASTDPSTVSLLEFERGVYYSDGRLDLCKQVVGPATISHLMTSLMLNQHVKHFLLGNNIIGTYGAQVIGKFIKSAQADGATHGKIQTWYLAGNCIDGDGIQHIAAALETDQYCTALWLKRNPLLSAGATAIKQLLYYNRNIQILDLDNVGLTDTGLKQICDGMCYNDLKLKHLYINGNGITHIGAGYLAEYFQYANDKQDVGLISLFAAVNRIGDQGAVTLANSLKDNKYLHRLNLSSNRIEGAGAKALCTALHHHPTLKYFSLGYYASTTDLGELPNRLEDAGASAVAELICINKSLQVIELSHNAFTQDGLMVLCRSILNNDQLVHVDIGERAAHLSYNMQTKLHTHLLHNIQSQYGTITREQFVQTHLKLLRNIEQVQHIESVYRTRDFATKASRRAVKKMWDTNDSTLIDVQEYGRTVRDDNTTDGHDKWNNTVVFGTYKLSGQQCIDGVYNAIAAGYRMIDTAVMYENHNEIGIAILNAIQDGLCTRGEIHITTKIRNRTQRQGSDAIQASVTAALNELRTDYIDCVLLHHCISAVLQQSWQTLLHLKQMKICRSIGVSNFKVPHLSTLYELYPNAMPSVNQIECSIYQQQHELRAYCLSMNTRTQAYGLFKVPTVPQVRRRRYHQQVLTHPSVELYRSICPTLPTPDTPTDSVETLILVAWCIKNGIQPIVQTFTHLEENLRAVEYSTMLNDDIVDILMAVNTVKE